MFVLDFRAIVMFHIRSNREENFADIRKTQYRTMALGCQVMLAINDDMKDLKLTDDNVLYMYVVCIRPQCIIRPLMI